MFFGDLGFISRTRRKYLESNGKESYADMHVGLFDYCTGIIFHFLTALAVEGIKSKNTIVMAISIVLSIILVIPRLIFAAVLTLVSLPFIAIAQAYFSDKGDKLKQIISSHQIHDGKTSNSLGKLLEKNNTPLDEIELEKTKKEFVENRNTFSITFFNPNEKGELKVILNLRDQNHQQVFKAMSKLNIANMQGEIEEDLVLVAPSMS